MVRRCQAILAIGYTLLRAWIDELDAGNEALEVE
jgi:hypothetical protein